MAEPAAETRDDELLARIARGDDEPTVAGAAQAEFYARHVRYLYGMLRRQQDKLLHLAGASAEDVVQETFHRAFERAAHVAAPQAAVGEKMIQNSADATSPARCLRNPMLPHVSGRGTPKERLPSPDLRMPTSLRTFAQPSFPANVTR